MAMYEPFFSHIYVERDAYAYPLTEQILARKASAVIIPIDHYKDVFNRPGQVFVSQKNSQKLILAVRRNNFLFPVAKLCDHHGQDNFYYATQMMNCPYDCDYCYLRGMYDSANIVAFVNTGDYFKAISELPVPASYISISYETDLLAMESLFGFAGKWMGFAAEQPALTVEIRTKSAVVLPMKPAFNVIMAWTITPGNYEKGAPSADKRLAALSKALDGGWPVRLCIDPVLPVHGWEDGLQRLTARIKQSIDVSRLHSVGAGGFRCSSAHYKRMRKHHPGSVITALPVAEQNGVITCPPEIETKIKSIVEKGLTP